MRTNIELASLCSRAYSAPLVFHSSATSAFVNLAQTISGELRESFGRASGECDVESRLRDYLVKRDAKFRDQTEL
jgi:hypothetical protein